MENIIQVDWIHFLDFPIKIFLLISQGYYWII